MGTLMPPQSPPRLSCPAQQKGPERAVEPAHRAHPRRVVPKAGYTLVAGAATAAEVGLHQGGLLLRLLGPPAPGPPIGIGLHHQGLLASLLLLLLQQGPLQRYRMGTEIGLLGGGGQPTASTKGRAPRRLAQLPTRGHGGVQSLLRAKASCPWCPKTWSSGKEGKTQPRELLWSQHSQPSNSSHPAAYSAEARVLGRVSAELGKERAASRGAPLPPVRITPGRGQPSRCSPLEMPAPTLARMASADYPSSWSQSGSPAGQASAASGCCPHHLRHCGGRKGYSEPVHEVPRCIWVPVHLGCLNASHHSCWVHGRGRKGRATTWEATTWERA